MSLRWYGGGGAALNSPFGLRAIPDRNRYEPFVAWKQCVVDLVNMVAISEIIFISPITRMNLPSKLNQY